MVLFRFYIEFSDYGTIKGKPIVYLWNIHLKVTTRTK